MASEAPGWARCTARLKGTAYLAAARPVKFDEAQPRPLTRRAGRGDQGAHTTAPPASQQLVDPTRARTGVAASAAPSKVFERDKDGRLTGYLETKADGEVSRQTFLRDGAGRIAQIVTTKAGTTPPGAAFKSRGGFLPKPTMTVAEQDAWQKTLHKAAWQVFVAKHGRDVIIKSYRDHAR